MTHLMITGAVVLLLSIAFSKLLYRVGVPTLIIFLLLGMLYGSDSIGGIYFDNFKLTENISSMALAFIIFYGGFGTRWKTASPVALQAILLSSVGTTVTALLTGLFCHYVLGFPLLEAMLIGAVISSTDAASVFSILRSRNLKLKNGLAPMLEVESGSNDPFAYLLTVVVITMMTGAHVSVPVLLAQQLIFGMAVGTFLGIGAVYVLKYVKFDIESFPMIFAVAIAILSYYLSELMNGNGYLSVYIAGIIIGNSRITHKRSINGFLNGVSWLMQITLFFMLGLLSFPSRLPSVAPDGTLIALFLIFAARPAAVFAILSWFKVPFKSRLFVSWVGIRGAASIVFAIFAMMYVKNISDVYHIVFYVVILSVLLQGTLLPWIAEKLSLTTSGREGTPQPVPDSDDDVFSQLWEMKINNGSDWADKRVSDLNLPRNTLIVMIKRKSGVVIPRGDTVIKPGDVLVVSGNDIKNITM